MKMECMDIRNPILIRVATIVAVDTHRLKVHFDGWSDLYDFWVDDDCTDIHPANWCARTGHPLMAPLCEYIQLDNSLCRGGVGGRCMWE